MTLDKKKKKEHYRTCKVHVMKLIIYKKIHNTSHKVMFIILPNLYLLTLIKI